MKRILFVALLSTVLSCGVALAIPIPFEQPQTVPKDVTKIFDKPLYANSLWGLRVVDLETGDVVLEQNPDHPFFIGSVRKIFSVGLLLNKVGADHTYDTPVYRQGAVVDGVLDGDLVLLASGDLTMAGRTNPDGTLDITDFDHNEANSLGNAVLSKPDPLAGYKDLARQVAESGIRKVTGDVIIDDRLFEPFDFRGEFKVKPIFVNDDVVDVTLSPTSPGKMAIAEVRPQSVALDVVNSVRTTEPGSALDLDLKPEVAVGLGTPNASVEITGDLPVDFKPPYTDTFPLVRTFRIADPSSYARSVFVEALLAQGVEVDADVVKPNPIAALPGKGTYAESDRVAKLVGTPFGETARFILKVSYNIGADMSLMLFGLNQGADNLRDALTMERHTLVSDYGLNADDFKFVDGSGGGPTTATNAAVTSILQKLDKSPQRAVFFNALPTLAVDGSLGFVKEFLSDPTLAGAAGQIRAKTGTFVSPGPNGLVVRGQAFGGVIETESGRRLAYQLVVNEVDITGLDQLLEIFQDQGTISAILWRDLDS